MIDAHISEGVTRCEPVRVLSQSNHCHRHPTGRDLCCRRCWGASCGSERGGVEKGRARKAVGEGRSETGRVVDGEVRAEDQAQVGHKLGGSGGEVCVALMPLPWLPTTGLRSVGGGGPDPGGQWRALRWMRLILIPILFLILTLILI